MKRQRGRGRKPGNPNNRSYESNGPDVKIRGNANQIYEKYLQYARDAQTSGDRIAAEAYFQHAEHYSRIVAANAPKEKPPAPQDEAAEAQPSENGADVNAEESAKPEAQADGEASPLAVVDGVGEQPADIASDDAQQDEKPAPRRRGRPRRRPQNTEAEQNGADAAPSGDDAGLRAMMARSSTPAPEADTAPAEHPES